MDQDRTHTLDDVARTAPSRLSLVVFHQERASVIPLRAGHPVVLGRSRDADVRLDHPSISRRHTRFELVGDEVQVEDLGSKNGTLLNGVKTGRGAVRPSDRVGIGCATVTLHVLPAALPGPGLDTHEALRQVLADATRWSAAAGQKVALLVVRTETASGGIDRSLERIDALLRSVDRLAAYSHDAAEVLLLDAAPERLDQIARAIVQGLAPGEPVLRCGIAVFPDSAGSAEELVSAASRAARRAGAATPIVWAPSLGRSIAPADLEVEPQRLVVRSPVMQKLFQTVEQVALSAIPVLITGETGTGKELVARALHERSPRRAKPLIAINCAAIPSSLLESELFGHERGAFTGAEKLSKGIFEEASGGSVLLDEIGELSPAAQAALLRVLETKRFCRIGSKKELQADVRVIAATHRDLEAMAGAGDFRWDLLYRINAVTLAVPPLRERPEEIQPLAEHFLAHASRAAGLPSLGIEPEAMALLVQFPWPGNIRELRNVIERGVALSRGRSLGVLQLPERVLVVAAVNPSGGREDRDRRAEAEEQAEEQAEEAATNAHQTFRELILQTEAALIAQALLASGWNRTAAARALRLPLRTLTDKLRALGVSPAGARPADAALIAKLEEVAPRVEGEDFQSWIRRYELELITRALRACGGSRTGAAQLLNMSLRTLREKIRLHGL